MILWHLLPGAAPSFLAFLTPLGGWPICSVTVAYFAPVGRPVCSGHPAVLLRNMQRAIQYH